MREKNWKTEIIEIESRIKGKIKARTSKASYGVARARDFDELDSLYPNSLHL